MEMASIQSKFEKIALHSADKTFQNAFVQGIVDNNLHELYQLYQ